MSEYSKNRDKERRWGRRKRKGAQFEAGVSKARTRTKTEDRKEGRKGHRLGAGVSTERTRIKKMGKKEGAQSGDRSEQSKRSGKERKMVRKKGEGSTVRQSHRCKYFRGTE